MIYCPRCDKPLHPDHRCLSRRFFFGLVASAIVAPAVPKVVEPIMVTSTANTNPVGIIRDYILDNISNLTPQ